MQLVEKHIISRHHCLDKEIDNLSFLSQNLFNYANYLIRQAFIRNGEYLNYYKIQKLCQGSTDKAENITPVGTTSMSNDVYDK